jgi:iduronate 2-sulfatase
MPAPVTHAAAAVAAAVVALAGSGVVPAVASAADTVAVPPPMNVFLIAVDDLRPLFGRSYGVEEVLAPNMDRHFLDRNGSAMQNSYVQIAVCGPSRSSILTSRRPDTTRVGVQVCVSV